MIKGNTYQINRGDTREGTLKLKLALTEEKHKNNMRSCFSLKVQQNYWRLQKKKWEVQNVIGLANVLPYRDLLEEITLFYQLSDGHEC